MGSGFRGSEVQGSEVQGSEVRGSWVQGSGFRGSEVQGSGFSTAAGLKSGQFNRMRKFEKANNEYRILLRRTVSKE
jgi:hypothetical protein